MFVMIMCCLELAITMLVMNLHNRASSEPLTAVPQWVRYRKIQLEGGPKK